MLYQAFVIHRNGSLDVFADAPARAATLWNYEIGHGQTAEWVARVKTDTSIHTMGVHWLACMCMAEHDRQLIAAFWQRHGLVESPEQAIHIIESVIAGASAGDRAFAERRRGAIGKS